MCGICGVVNSGNRSMALERLDPMLERLASRGPDAAGVFMQNKVALGQRRLKIIDLSEKAQQPMVDAFPGLTIVYNYKDIRRMLEGKGYRFFAQGDTEIILKAFHAWGEDCASRLNGMFAFCILQRDSGRLFFARDRLGIKPLYYSANAGQFCFASTLPALLTLPDIDRRIDPAALNYYLSFHSVVPAPHTIVQGIRKLPPATTLTVEPDGSTRIHTYWELNFFRSAHEEELDEAGWRERVQQELDAAVQSRLTADVPVGVLLSGGLDSWSLT